MISDQFVWLGAGVNLLACAGYVAATVRGQARPNRVSWGLWSITSWLAFAGQLAEGVGTPAILTLTVALGPSLIFVGSFVGGAYWEFSTLDIVCCALWTVGVITWQVTASGIVAIVLSIAVDAIAGIPTVEKAWRDPASESHIAYTAGMFSGACTLLSLTSWTIATAAFAIYFFSLCTVINVLLLVVAPLRRAALRRSLPPATHLPPRTGPPRRDPTSPAALERQPSLERPGVEVRITHTLDGQVDVVVLADPGVPVRFTVPPQRPPAPARRPPPLERPTRARPATPAPRPTPAPRLSTALTDRHRPDLATEQHYPRLPAAGRWPIGGPVPQATSSPDTPPSGWWVPVGHPSHDSGRHHRQGRADAENR